MNNLPRVVTGTQPQPSQWLRLQPLIISLTPHHCATTTPPPPPPPVAVAVAVVAVLVVLVVEGGCDAAFRQNSLTTSSHFISSQ